MSDYLDLSAMDADQRAALHRFLISVADSKRILGIRYSDWLLGAPSIETGIATSSMAQDEWGHARLLYSMLKELDVDPVEVEHDRADEDYASVDPLDEPFGNWAAVIAGMVVVDGALATLLESFSRGRFEPATMRVPKMLDEEAFHWSLASAWFRRLATSSSASARSKLSDAATTMLPPVLAWLGAEDDADVRLVELGVLEPASDRVQAFRDEVRDVLAQVGIDVDEAQPSDGWDAARRRGPGHPGHEATERARGDRNRMLFVE